MKKIISIIVFCLAAVCIFNACSDSEFDKRFPDPSKTDVVTVDKLMTGTFERGNLYTMPWYWRYYTFEIRQIGRFTQLMGFINGSGMYELTEGYNNDRWIQFYKMLAQYRLLEDTWEKMPEADKAAYEIFKPVTRIFIYDHLHQLVDLWGDVPFTQAGYVGITADIEGSKAPYDKAEDLYKLMLDDLKSINSFIAGFNPTSLVGTKLREQDYINAGDLYEWRRYCNSLRLRIASRAAENGALTSEARSVISEIFSDPNTYPVVTSNDENILIKHQPPTLTAVETQHENGIRGGFESSSGYYNRASYTYIDALEGDPRLDVIYDKNADGVYLGIDPKMVSTEQQNLFDRPTDQGGNAFSAVDTSTFSRNNRFPGVIVTAAEISFIRAEAIQKWGLSGSAEQAFKDAVSQSIEFYFHLNSEGDYRESLPKPSDADIESFATKKWSDYGSKEEAIATQRWIHYGLVQMVQAWGEYRKTGYPELYFQTDNGSVDVKTPPARLLYTTNERNYNMDNYRAVQEKDGYYDKLFWAK